MIFDDDWFYGYGLEFDFDNNLVTETEFFIDSNIELVDTYYDIDNDQMVYTFEDNSLIYAMESTYLVDDETMNTLADETDILLASYLF